MLGDLSDATRRPKAAKSCTLLPLSCHSLFDNTHCNLDTDRLVESWRCEAYGQWLPCVYICVWIWVRWAGGWLSLGEHTNCPSTLRLDKDWLESWMYNVTIDEDNFPLCFSWQQSFFIPKENLLMVLQLCWCPLFVLSWTSKSTIATRVNKPAY